MFWKNMRKKVKALYSKMISKLISKMKPVKFCLKKGVPPSKAKHLFLIDSAQVP